MPSSPSASPVHSRVDVSPALLPEWWTPPAGLVRAVLGVAVTLVMALGAAWPWLGAQAAWWPWLSLLGLVATVSSAVWVLPALWVVPHRMVLMLVALWSLSRFGPSVPGLNPLNLALGLAVLRGLSLWRVDQPQAAPGWVSAWPLCWGMGLPLTWGAIVAVDAGDGAWVWHQAVKPLAYFVGGALLLAQVIRHSDPGVVLRAMALTLAGTQSTVAALVGWEVLRQTGGSPAALATLVADREFLTHLGLHANELGMMMALGSGPLLALALRARDRRLRAWCAASLVMVWPAIVLTFSRGAMLVAMVSMVGVVSARAWDARSRRRAWGVLVLTALLAWSLSPNPLRDRLAAGLHVGALQDTAVVSRDQLTAGRVQGWKLLWPEVLEHPWWGAGLGSTRRSQAYLTGAYQADHPHNIVLELLMDLGALGAGLAAGLAARLLWGLRCLARQENAGPGEPGGGDASVWAQGAWWSAVGGLLMAVTTAYYLPNAAQAPMWMTLALLLAWPRTGR